MNCLPGVDSGAATLGCMPVCSSTTHVGHKRLQSLSESIFVPAGLGSGHQPPSVAREKLLLYQQRIESALLISRPKGLHIHHHIRHDVESSFLLKSAGNGLIDGRHYESRSKESSAGLCFPHHVREERVLHFSTQSLLYRPAISVYGQFRKSRLQSAVICHHGAAPADHLGQTSPAQPLSTCNSSACDGALETRTHTSLYAGASNVIGTLEEDVKNSFHSHVDITRITPTSVSDQQQPSISSLFVNALYRPLLTFTLFGAVVAAFCPGLSSRHRHPCAHSPLPQVFPAAMARISSNFPPPAAGPHPPPTQIMNLHTPPPTPPPSAAATPATSPLHTHARTERSQSAPTTPTPRNTSAFAARESLPSEPRFQRPDSDTGAPSISRSSPIHSAPLMPPPPRPIPLPASPALLRVGTTTTTTTPATTTGTSSGNNLYYRISEVESEDMSNSQAEQQNEANASTTVSSATPRRSGSQATQPGNPTSSAHSRVNVHDGSLLGMSAAGGESSGIGTAQKQVSESPILMDDLAARAYQSSPSTMTRVAAVIPGLDDIRPDPLVVFVGGPGRRRKTNTFVKQAADRVGPAVVRLDTERDAPASEAETGEDRDRLFRQWFGDSDLQVPRRFRRERGQGSGFVLDGREGTIITNAHVVKGADRVKVSFTDGRVFEGEVAGTDEVTDLALVKVSTRDGELLPKAPLGDSSTVELGDWVIAVGNPFGLDNTVSLGIISNLRRTAAEVGIPDKRLDFLQTDCAINPGNSGGPLLNEFGEVIGITTAIRADAEGIAFAIPINNARRIIEALGQGQAVKHPFLGIQMANLTPDLARQYNADPNTGVVIPEIYGVLVIKVSPQSPAALAGFRFGDVIVQVEGQDLRLTSHLQKYVDASAIGQSLRMKVQRGEKAFDVLVKTGDMSPFFGSKSGAKDAGGGKGRTPLQPNSAGSGMGSGGGSTEDPNMGAPRCDPGGGCLGDQHHHGKPESKSLTPSNYGDNVYGFSFSPSSSLAEDGRGATNVAPSPPPRGLEGSWS